MVQSLQEARFYMVPLFGTRFTKLFKKSKKVDETNIQFANSSIGVNNHLIEKVLPNLKWGYGYRKFNRPFWRSASRKRPRPAPLSDGRDGWGFMRGFSTSRGHAALSRTIRHPKGGSPAG